MWQITEKVINYKIHVYTLTSCVIIWGDKTSLANLTVKSSVDDTSGLMHTVQSWKSCNLANIRQVWSVIKYSFVFKIIAFVMEFNFLNHFWLIFHKISTFLTNFCKNLSPSGGLFSLILVTLWLRTQGEGDRGEGKI